MEKGKTAQATLPFFRFVFAALFLAAAIFPADAARVQQKAAAKKPSAGSPQPTAKKTSSKTSAKKSKKKRATSARNRAQKAPTSDRILEIQGALARGGYYSGEPSGKWDASSISAMKDFQQAHGLKAIGKISAASLQKLGLGSQTSGVAAPRASVSSGEGASRNH